ncbi:MAG: hypothetical protein WCL35_09450 [bacterium]
MRITPRVIAFSFTALSLVVISACGGSESGSAALKTKNVAISNGAVNAGPTTSYATGLNMSPMPTSALPMIPQTTEVQKVTPTSVFTATTAPSAPAINKNVVNMGPTTTEALAKPTSSATTEATKPTTAPTSTTTTVAKKTTKKKKKSTK